MSLSIAIIGSRGYPSYYGGFETAVRKLAPYLAERGHRVTVYGRAGTVREDDPSRDPRVRTVQTWGVESKMLSTLSHGLSSCLAARRLRPDVALVMNVANGYWLPALRTAGIPTLVNVDGIEWEREKWNSLAKSLFRTGARLTARFGDELVYDSRAIKDRWESEFGRAGLFIPYGGDFAPANPVDSPFETGSYALLVARFVPENTIEEFFGAAEKIARTNDVVLVGSAGYGGPLDESARRLADSSPNVHWLGHVSDDGLLHSLWRNAGAYFHGHSVGGTNPALVQAMALGAPVVARDTVYNREVLGDQGIFVKPRADEIAEVILDLLSDQRRQEDLRRTSVERVRAAYTWEMVNCRYADALERLAGAR